MIGTGIACIIEVRWRSCITCFKHDVITWKAAVCNIFDPTGMIR